MTAPFCSRRTPRFWPLACAGSLALFASACGGGGGGGGPGTATGQFKDSNVSGLEYVSGSRSGTTDELGFFTYERNSPVTFSVGAVTLGSASGNDLVTPLDLVAGGSSDHQAVVNIARFLQMLDEDGDPDEGGISISADVRAQAGDWPALDFDVDVDDFGDDADVAHIVTQVGGVLPAPAVAQAHLEKTLRCAYAGAFVGNYRQNGNGSARGQFGLLVSALTGEVQGWVWSQVDEFGDADDIDAISLSGSQAVSYDQDRAFVSGFGGDGSNFEGRFTSPNSLTGTYAFAYAQGANGGTFSGSRIGGSANAVWRFTGLYGGTTYGVFAFDIDASGSVIGRAHNIEDDESTVLGGNLSGSTLTVTAGGATIATATLNTATGTLTGGTWDDGTDSGTFNGDGCRLN